jgi:DNA-directed RNA polymerase subunit F
MIHENNPLSMAESLEYINAKEKTELVGFIKKFTDLKAKDGIEIRQKIEELALLKIKPRHIAKIIDLLPETTADLNKIFDDISLDEDEANKILNIIKQYK